MSAAQTILDCKSRAVHDIEAGKIKSVIAAIADSIRRKALKLLNELKRAV